MQIPRKMSAQNVMASISRTLGTSRPDYDSKASNEIKLAGEESKDKLYERQHRQKAFRIMTVVAYVISVSLAAIILSLYYTFIWDPKDHTMLTTTRQTNQPINKQNITRIECSNSALSTGQTMDESIMEMSSIEMSETTSTKQNSTDFLKKLKTIYPSVYIAEDQIIDESTELEADSLDTQPIIISSSSTMSSDELEEISEEAVDETLDVQFESQNLPRR